VIENGGEDVIEKIRNSFLVCSESQKQRGTRTFFTPVHGPGAISDTGILADLIKDFGADLKSAGEGRWTDFMDCELRRTDGRRRRKSRTEVGWCEVGTDVFTLGAGNHDFDLLSGSKNRHYQCCDMEGSSERQSKRFIHKTSSRIL
jgi:hypothetical protein